MAVSLSLRKWNSDSTATNDFEIITKITTLGNPTELKSILGFYYNIRQNTAYTDDTPNNYILALSYRFELNKPWNGLHTINNVITPHTDEGATSRSIKHILTYPIKDVSQIQLRFHSPLLRGDFNINDFGLIYRTIRDTSVSDHDED